MEPTKYDPLCCLCQKMAAIWRTQINARVYNELMDSIVLEIAKKEMQDAVDGAGLDGHVKIYLNKPGNERNKKMEWDEDRTWSG